MKCFVCNRTERQVMLLKLPVETSYDGETLEIVGNVVPTEYICLPCVGFQYDEIELRKVI